MDPVAPDPPPPRLLLPTGHTDLRVTWHSDRPDDSSSVVLSLWHDHLCAASARLSTREAARLAGFLVDHLAAQAIAAEDTAAAQQGDRRGGDADDARHPDPAGPSVAAATAGSDHDTTVPLDVAPQRHLRPAPDPGAGQRLGATVDEAIAAGGAALTAAVDAARRAWRTHRD